MAKSDWLKKLRDKLDVVEVVMVELIRDLEVFTGFLIVDSNPQPPMG